MGVDPKWSEILTENPLVVLALAFTCGALLAVHWLGAVPRAPWWAIGVSWAGFLFFGFICVLNLVGAWLDRRDERRTRGRR